MSGALVTGAAGGLGREIAARLARRGHVVHLTDVDGDRAERAAAELGGAAFGSALDVRDPDACRAAARRTAERGGSLDVWVNNAGVLIPGPVWSHTDAERRLMMEVNALGTMHGTVAALELMRPAGRGHVLNIVSLAGLAPVPGEGVYAASKHAAIGFSLSTLADLRLAKVKGVAVSCVCPDGIWTPMLHDKLDDPGASLSFSGTLLTASRVADAVDRVLDRPRPVTVIPRWRGWEARVFDALPRVAIASVPAVVALSRVQQRAARRRLLSAGRPGSAPRPRPAGRGAPR